MAKRTITSPVGRASWPWLSKPNTKFDPEGHFKVNLVLPPGEETEAFIENLDEMNAAAFRHQVQTLTEEGGNKATLAKKLTQRDTIYSVDEDTGEYEIAFKAKAGGTRKDGTRWTQRVPLFDAGGTPLPLGVVVGAGSTIRVAFMVDEEGYAMASAKEAGISLRLSAVQVIELVAFGERDAAGYGFDAVEGGFSADDVDADAFEDEDEDDEADEAEDDEESFDDF